MNEIYPEIWSVIATYFHEDSDLFGDNVRDLIMCYKGDVDREIINDLLGEIDRFKLENHDDLSSAFAREFPRQFVPELWGYTADTFLEELKRLLKE